MMRLPLTLIIGLFVGFNFMMPALAQDTDQITGLEDALTPPQPFKVVGFGDSLMAGYRLDIDQSFTAKLEKALHERRYNVDVINAGVSGDTTTGGHDRIDWSVPDDTGLVILELGANDMLRGITPQISEQNLDAMLERLKMRKIPVILVGMLSAPNLGKDYADKFNPIYARLAAKYQVPIYPFFTDGITGNLNLQLDDGMHPNAVGIDVMVKNFMPIMLKELTQLNIQPDP